LICNPERLCNSQESEPRIGIHRCFAIDIQKKATTLKDMNATHKDRLLLTVDRILDSEYLNNYTLISISFVSTPYSNYFLYAAIRAARSPVKGRE
jgi:hypothetical protein